MAQPHDTAPELHAAGGGALMRGALMALALVAGGAGAARADAVEEAGALARRVVPAIAGRIRFEGLSARNGRDAWEVAAAGGRVTVRGSTGVAMASGLNWYLENRCRCDISWCGVNLRLPARLPDVRPTMRGSTAFGRRYFLNYCAFSYSLAWFGWDQWERLIDWMALHGINMPLAVTGQEAVWLSLGRRLGLSDGEMDRFFVGPAFLPFGWMGCMDGWGGPLPAGWIARQRGLERRILARERALGMTPVLQGFTGHVPAAVARVFPGARLLRLPSWAAFDGTSFIDPADPLFRTVGRAFVEEQTRLYGSDHLYAADTFIEMSPPSSDPAFLQQMGRAVLGAMTDADPAAVWVMQGWLFVNNPSFWKPAQARALLTSVPDDRMMVLDLMCESDPAWLKTSAFHGKPWLFCMIQTFGDTVSMHGGLAQIAANLRRARTDASAGKLVGLGHIMEGLGCNPAMHSFLTDMIWRRDVPRAEAWVDGYALRRYGRPSAAAREAWRLLLRTLYSSAGPSGSILTCRPAPGLGTARMPAEAARAWRRLLDAAGELGDRDTYRFDLANLTRQMVGDAAGRAYDEMMSAYGRRDRAALRAAGARLMATAADLDALLGTRRELLLGRWLADARRWGETETDRRHLEWNARVQITLWGPHESGLHEYAQKQWSGMMLRFYGARWQRFVDALDGSLANGAAFDAGRFEAAMRDWEVAWTRGAERYAETPRGDTVAEARRLFARYPWRTARRDALSLTTGKPATCSHSLGPYPASLANDGVLGDTDSYWATDVGLSPAAWWQVDLLRPTQVGRVVVVGYYGDRRSYGFTVEGSLDGRTWTMLADRRENRELSTREGITCRFAPRLLRRLRVTLTSSTANTGRHLVEVMAYGR